MHYQEKRGYPDHQEEIPAKHAKHASDAKKTASSQPSDKAAAAGQSDSNKGGDVAGLLESLVRGIMCTTVVVFLFVFVSPLYQPPNRKVQATCRVPFFFVSQCGFLSLVSFLAFLIFDLVETILIFCFAYL